MDGIKTCELCKKSALELFRISKQMHGAWRLLHVCGECKAEHERELELTRENFRRQFGEK